MGGTVAETIRKENGEIIKMARKTGAYNWMIFTKDFCTDDFDTAIEKHVKVFFDMREDFKSGKPYKFPMSPVYGPLEELNPIAYGLVVIDFQKKKIHSMQGYDRPGGYNFSGLSHIGKENKDDLNYIISNNLLNVVNHKGKNLGDIETIFGKGANLERLQKEIQNSFNPVNVIFSKLFKNDFDYFDLLLVPKNLINFEVIVYEESQEGIIKYLSNLAEDGFTFNSKEIENWKTHICFDDCDWLSEEDFEKMTESEIDMEIDKRKKTFNDEIDSLGLDVVKKTKPLKK